MSWTNIVSFVKKKPKKHGGGGGGGGGGDASAVPEIPDDPLEDFGDKAPDPAKTAGQVITCKAAVLYGAEEQFVVEDIQVEPPKQSEVRVKILFSSICHTDLASWKGENDAQRVFPRILGHEAAGIVESVGEGVTELKSGDQVIPIFHGECGECEYCKSKKTNKCSRLGVDPRKSTMSDGGTRFTKDDKPIYHFMNCSTFTEYTVLDQGCVVKLGTSPLSKMTLLSCCVSTGVGAAWNIANVQAGSTVAVFGLGAVGFAAAEGARSRGATKIIGIDINISKFEKGRAFGITDFINPHDVEKPVHEIIREMSGGGVDYSFECAGNLEILREAFLSTHDGWGLTVILGIHTKPKTLQIHPMEFFEGRNITASIFGGFKGKSDLASFAKQCKGNVNLAEFISHELPFEKINEALELLKEGQAIRCQLIL